MYKIVIVSYWTHTIGEIAFNPKRQYSQKRSLYKLKNKSMMLFNRKGGDSDRIYIYQKYTMANVMRKKMKHRQNLCK